MRGLVASLLAAACLSHVACGFAAVAPPPRPAVSLSSLPVEFEANQGQHPPEVRYLARAAGYRLALTHDGAMIAPARGAGSAPVSMRFVGAGNASLVPQERSGHRTSYLPGDGAGARHTDIPNFARVAYRQLYPGVDAVFYARNGEIEYDFVLAPGADPRRIELAFTGARKLTLDAQGDLLIHTAAGVLVQHRPAVYQEHEGRRTAVPTRYSVAGNRVRFELARYDRSRGVTIDPVLSYSTYVAGGSTDSAYAIAVDAAGNAYIAGATSSGNWPVAGAYQASLAGTQDAYVAKLNPQGTGLVYSTYIGGRRSITSAQAIAIDAAGNAYIAGTTNSNTYPVTTGAYSAALASGGAFVTKLNAAGNGLVYSTYLPGANPVAIRVDASGNAYLVGGTAGGLPTTPGALQVANPSTVASSGFVAKLNAAGSALLYSTYLGGSGDDAVKGLAIDGTGNAYLTGYARSANFPLAAPYQPALKGSVDGFVAKLNPGGNTLVFSTYLGGTDRDYGNAIAVDANGRIYLAGDSYSVDFPVVNGYAKPLNNTGYNVATITVMEPGGASLAMSTYFGGAACLGPSGGSCVPNNPTDVATAIAVDPSGNHIYVAGYLSSLVVDSLGDPVQRDLNGRMDAFVLKMVVDGVTQRILNIRYATRLGGDGAEKATGLGIDAQGNAYIVGSDAASTFPTTQGALRKAGAGGSDVFVAKLSTLGRAVELNGGCYADGTQLRASTALNATGSITFHDGTTVLATVPIVNGLAAYSGPTPAGAHKFTAVRSTDQAASQAIFCATR